MAHPRFEFSFPPYEMAVFPDLATIVLRSTMISGSAFEVVLDAPLGAHGTPAEDVLDQLPRALQGIRQMPSVQGDELREEIVEQLALGVEDHYDYP